MDIQLLLYIVLKFNFFYILTYLNKKAYWKKPWAESLERAGAVTATLRYLKIDIDITQAWRDEVKLTQSFGWLWAWESEPVGRSIALGRH